MRSLIREDIDRAVLELETCERRLQLVLIKLGDDFEADLFEVLMHLSNLRFWLAGQAQAGSEPVPVVTIKKG